MHSSTTRLVQVHCCSALDKTSLALRVMCRDLVVMVLFPERETEAEQEQPT